MATHSSILAWRIPWTEEHGGVAMSWIRLKRLSMVGAGADITVVGGLGSDAHARHDGDPVDTAGLILMKMRMANRYWFLLCARYAATFNLHSSKKCSHFPSTHK